MPKIKYNLPLEKIKEEYLRGKSPKTLAKECNCTPNLISYHLTKMDVKRPYAIGLWGILSKEQRQEMEKNGINQWLFYWRINAGWDIDKAVSTPKRVTKPPKVKPKSSSVKLKDLLIKSNTRTADRS